MKPYYGRIRITCSDEGHDGRKTKNSKATCINCPGSLVEVLDLEGNVIATLSAFAPPDECGHEED